MQHLLLSCIESRIENNQTFYGRFQLGPFNIGQGLTIATALRRTLLSELVGLAITAVTIKNASHEYSTLTGVRESVLDITLNLKQIIFAYVEEEQVNNLGTLLQTINSTMPKPQLGFLKACGPGIITAKNMKLPENLRCVDPDQYIATLSEDGFLEMKFTISEGTNYVVQKNPQKDFQGYPPNLEKKSTKLLPSSNNYVFPKKLRFQGGQKNENVNILNTKWSSRSGVAPNGSASTLLLPESTPLINQQKKGKLISQNSFLSKWISFAFNTNVKKNSLNLTTLTTKTATLMKMSQPVFFNKLKKNMLSNKSSTQSQINNGVIADYKTSDFIKSLSSKDSDNLSSTFKKQPLITLEQEQTFNLPKPLDKKLLNKYSLKKVNTSKFTLKPTFLKKIEVELLKTDKLTNVLLIDAVFMPVKKVNFILENDDETLQLKEKITLEVWTNGSIHPREAIYKAASTIIQMISPFQQNQIASDIIAQTNFQQLKDAKTIKFAAKKENLAIKKNRSLIDIGNLNLSLKPYISLKRANINTISDLIQCSPDELLLLKNFNQRSLVEVETSLGELGLKLKLGI